MICREKADLQQQGALLNIEFAIAREWRQFPLGAQLAPLHQAQVAAYRLCAALSLWEALAAEPHLGPKPKPPKSPIKLQPMPIGKPKKVSRFAFSLMLNSMWLINLDKTENNRIFSMGPNHMQVANSQRNKAKFRLG